MPQEKCTPQKLQMLRVKRTQAPLFYREALINQCNDILRDKNVSLLRNTQSPNSLTHGYLENEVADYLTKKDLHYWRCTCFLSQPVDT